MKKHYDLADEFDLKDDDQSSFNLLCIVEDIMECKISSTSGLIDLCREIKAIELDKLPFHLNVLESFATYSDGCPFSHSGDIRSLSGLMAQS